MKSELSRTSQAVAMIRAELDRPHSADGDPGAQRALCAGIGFTPPAWLRPGIEARTRFMDSRVVAALAAGVRQVVICGAGLDDRALRFRTRGVQFFEIDRPATQADKARRLQSLCTTGAAPILVACDFGTEAVADALAACGHDETMATLFLCEGLLIYLDRPACHRLLAGLASRSSSGSRLAASLATHAPGVAPAEVAAAANSRRRTGAAEPWLTILPPAEHLAMLAGAGWSVTESVQAPAASDQVSHGRRSLHVAAVPAR
jgi:methyltransferase (TIGR00027 family)